MLSGELMGARIVGGSGGVETDPTVPQYVKNISEQNIADWNGKASTSYVDAKVAELVNSAPDTLNTLGELASAIEGNKDLIDAIKVPTKTSELENDSGFITAEDVPSTDLSNYYTKSEIDSLVGSINTALENVLGV